LFYTINQVIRWCWWFVFSCYSGENQVLLQKINVHTKVRH